MAGERERQVMAQEASWVIWGRDLTKEMDNFRLGKKGRSSDGLWLNDP